MAHKPFTSIDNYCYWIFVFLLKKGDSGSPIWQYQFGRAVQIGIEIASVHGDTNCAKQLKADSVRVSQYIDWILQTINEWL